MANWPCPRAKSRTCRGLTTATWCPASISSPATRRSNPPVASITRKQWSHGFNHSNNWARPSSSYVSRHVCPPGNTATSKWRLATSIPTHTFNSGFASCMVNSLSCQCELAPPRRERLKRLFGLTPQSQCGSCSATVSKAPGRDRSRTGDFFRGCCAAARKVSSYENTKTTLLTTYKVAETRREKSITQRHQVAKQCRSKCRHSFASLRLCVSPCRPQRLRVSAREFCPANALLVGGASFELESQSIVSWKISGQER